MIPALHSMRRRPLPCCEVYPAHSMWEKLRLCGGETRSCWPSMMTLWGVGQQYHHRGHHVGWCGMGLLGSPSPWLLDKVVKDHGVIVKYHLLIPCFPLITCLLKAEVDHVFVIVRLSYNIIWSLQLQPTRRLWCKAFHWWHLIFQDAKHQTGKCPVRTGRGCWCWR